MSWLNEDERQFQHVITNVSTGEKKYRETLNASTI